MIKRDFYLNKLIARENNGMIKVITGIRRCGKSYLLDPIFKGYLIDKGIKYDHIIKIELDRQENVKFHHDPNSFNEYLNSKIIDENMHYFLLDEIQLVDGFEFVLNGLLYKGNVDVYVTGSNSKFLSSDIITEFRGRGDQIHVFPLSFKEFFESSKTDKYDAWNEYSRFGGMPSIAAVDDENIKSKYLKDLFEYTYFKDIIDRNKVSRVDVLDTLVNILASSIGSLTNPQKIYDTFKSNGEKELSLNTINSYIKYLEDSFLINKSMRYDVKGRKYISTPYKIYFADVGLRNARLNFRQNEETHIMENIVYNELLMRGYDVDVGLVELRDKNKRIHTEVDFVCNRGYQRYYIQSAFSLETSEKMQQEVRPFKNIDDSFKKIVVVKDYIRMWKTEDGVAIVSVFDFLLDSSLLEKC